MCEHEHECAFLLQLKREMLSSMMLKGCAGEFESDGRTVKQKPPKRREDRDRGVMMPTAI